MIKEVEIKIKENLLSCMPSFLQCIKIIAYDRDGNKKDYSELINTNQFTTKQELINYISKQLKIEKSIIKVIY